MAHRVRLPSRPFPHLRGVRHQISRAGAVLGSNCGLCACALGFLSYRAVRARAHHAPAACRGLHTVDGYPGLA